MKKFLGKTLFIAVLIQIIYLCVGTGVQPAYAENTPILIDKTESLKAEVVEITKSENREVPGTNLKTDFQHIRAKILEGKKSGEIITIENDYLALKVGQKFYVRYIIDAEDGRESYSVEEPYRIPQLFILTVLFLLSVIFFGGLQGLRGLLSLIGSLVLIVYVLLPGMLAGYSPILISILVSSLIIILGSYVTHGFNRTTSSAVMGMIITVIATGVLAFISVHTSYLTGFSDEAVVYINLNSGGNIDIVGLLLGGIMIGLLGVLYDVAIGQAITVEELLRIAPHVPKRKIYERAIRMGREHIGALVNTLAIAYVGTALPLLLWFYMVPGGSIVNVLNREIFATEIVRTMVGSIGLVLAVPITTFISIWFLTKNLKPAEKDIEKELSLLDQVKCTHSHNH